MVLVLVLMLMLMLMLTLMLMLMLTLMLVLVSVLMLVLVSVLVPASIVWLWLDSASFHPVSLQRPAALWSTWVCVCLHMCAHFLSIIFLWGGGGRQSHETQAKPPSPPPDLFLFASFPRLFKPCTWFARLALQELRRRALLPAQVEPDRADAAVCVLQKGLPGKEREAEKTQETPLQNKTLQSETKTLITQFSVSLFLSLFSRSLSIAFTPPASRQESATFFPTRLRTRRTRSRRLASEWVDE